MRIVAAVDFSAQTSKVVQVAVELASDGELILLYVAPPDPDFVGFDVGPQPIRNVTAGKLRGRHRKLQKLGESLDRAGLDVKALMAQGPTAAKIAEEAEKVGADLLVIGSHGHGALYTLVLGSTTEDVLRRTALPVVVVPPER